MRFTTTILSAALLSTASVLAQQAPITVPAAGTTITRGTNTTIRVSRPVITLSSIRPAEVDIPQSYIQSMTEAGLVLGIEHCPTSSNGTAFCDPPSEVLGTAVLYNGPFAPAGYSDSAYWYQEFSVVVPTWFQNGTARIGTARMALLGVGSQLEFNDSY